MAGGTSEGGTRDIKLFSGLTQIFKAPLEDVLQAMWRYVAIQTSRSATFHLHPPSQGRRTFTLKVTLDKWPEETPDWMWRKYEHWLVHGYWIYKDNLLWLRMAPENGEGEIRLEVSYGFGAEPGYTRRVITAEFDLPGAAAEAIEELGKALKGHFEQEHAMIRTMLSLPGQGPDASQRKTE